MAWSKNGTPDTLTTSGDALTISDTSSLKFNTILSHALDNGSNVTSKLRLINNTGNNYSDRRSYNGGADATDVSQSFIYAVGNQGIDEENFAVIYCVGIATEEKLCIIDAITSGITGAGNAPNRREIVGKLVDTTNLITQIDIFNDYAGSFDVDSNLSALGTD
jgi:hypothetical protein